MIETVRNPSGEIVYRARVRRLQPDGTLKYFQKDYLMILEQFTFGQSITYLKAN